MLNFWQSLTISDRLKGIILLVFTAVLWSSSGFFIKWIDWHPLAIAGTRSAIAAIVIRIAFHHHSHNRNLPQLVGAVAYSATMLTFVAATKLTTAANAILLQYTAPIYVALLGSWFLQEKPQFYDWLTISFVGGGMILFFQDHMSAGGLLGNLLAIGSGLCMAVMIVALRRQKDNSPFGSILWGNVLTFFCGLPFMFESSLEVSGWLAIAGLGFFQLGLSYVLYTVAITYVTALEASLVTVIEPMLNPLWVFLFLGEVPGPWALTGGFIILATITARYVLPTLKASNTLPAVKVNK
jgi:drug/metabolite transporter (DMT)-like permease